MARGGDVREDWSLLKVIVEEDVEGELVLPSVASPELGSGNEKMDVLPGETTLWVLWNVAGDSHVSTRSDEDWPKAAAR